MKKAIKVILATTLLNFSVAEAAFVCEPIDPNSGNPSEGPLQTVRNFFWMNMGFPGSTEYSCFHQENASIKAMVGQDGLVGRIEGIRSYVVEKIVAHEGKAITCQTVPTSGSFNVSATETITYETATQSPPATFAHTAAYDKRVKYTNTANNRVAIFEFHCDRSSMLAKIKDTLSGGDQNLVIFYDGEDSTSKRK